MTALRDALALLTRLPPVIIDTFGAHNTESANDHGGDGGDGGDRGDGGVGGRVMGWFPLVGLLVAGIGVLTWVVVEVLLGRTPAAVAAVLVTIAVTGALHEDGLADTFDGLWGGATRERRLEIMRDSSIGTYGTIALTGDLLLRVLLLAPLGMPDLARALVAGHVIGRLAPLLVVRLIPPARPSGLGATLGRPSRRDWLLAGGTAGVTAIVTGGLGAPLVVAAAAVPVLLLTRAASNRIGGHTGDILGAAVLTASLAATATIVALGAW